MVAGNYNFTIEQGATFKRILTWADRDKNPIDLTNYVVKMTMKYGSPRGEVAVALNVDNGMVSIEPTKGQITINIPASITSTLKPTKCVYDLVLFAPDGTVTRLLQGNIIISQGVTV